MTLALLLMAAQAVEETGSLKVVNAVPGMMVHVLRFSEGVKDAPAFAKLWSENDAAQQEALAALPEGHARFAPGRIKDLARIGSPQVRAMAQLKVDRLGAAEDPKPLVARAIADIEGVARFGKLPAGVFHVFATRPTSIDFHRQDVRIAAKEEVTLDAAGRPAKPGEAPAGAENAKAVIKVSQGDKVLGELALHPGRPAELGGLKLELVDPLGDAARLGQVQLVHKLYGVFVKLDPGFVAGPGEEIVIVRDGKEVARSTVVRVASADETYPDGAIQLSRDRIEIKKGDEIRRAK